MAVSAHARYIEIAQGNTKLLLLVHRLEYWFKHKKKGFYKFLSPCPGNESYRKRDSWTEELGCSRSTVHRNFKLVGVTYPNKAAWTAARDKFQGKLYCRYRDKHSNKTYYFRNHALMEQVLAGLVSFDIHVEPVTQTVSKPLRNEDLANSKKFEHVSSCNEHVSNCNVYSLLYKHLRQHIRQKNIKKENELGDLFYQNAANDDDKDFTKHRPENQEERVMQHKPHREDRRKQWFTTLWEHYPKAFRGGQRAAYLQFIALKPTECLVEEILQSIKERLAAEEEMRRKRLWIGNWKYMANWLKHEEWTFKHTLEAYNESAQQYRATPTSHRAQLQANIESQYDAEYIHYLQQQYPGLSETDARAMLEQYDAEIDQKLFFG